jgi:hypothetical protein
MHAVVDIRELPSAKPSETVIPISSVDDLVKPAVLRQAEEGRHTYCIIDSSVRYLYVVETQK